MLVSTPRRASLATALIGVGLLLGTSACAGQAHSAEESAVPADVTVRGFAILQGAATQLIREYQETPAGEGKAFETEFGPSGTLSRELASATKKADFVVLNVRPEMERLVKAGVVEQSWDDGPSEGILARSTVVFVVRKGNPKNIRSWADLTRPGVQIVSSDPGSAGNARWVLAAAYGQAYKAGGEESGKRYLSAFLPNVTSWNISGGAATRAFKAGQGDVLVTFESEAIGTRAGGEPVDYVVPFSTVLVEHPAASTKGASASTADLVSFTMSEEGQQIFADAGFRSTNPLFLPKDIQGAMDPANPFPKVNTFTIDDLGGWGDVDKKLFDPKSGLVTTIRAR